MATTRISTRTGCPERRWTDPAGRRWSAKLITPPRAPGEDAEIQVDGEGGVPERVLCAGLTEPRFRQLSDRELELIRRAAEARSGIVWIDPRDGRMWWVEESADAGDDPKRARATYSDPGRTVAADRDPDLAVTLLDDAEHQRLLDDALGR